MLVKGGPGYHTPFIVMLFVFLLFGDLRLPSSNGNLGDQKCIHSYNYLDS